MACGIVRELVRLGPGRARREKARTEAARIRANLTRCLRAAIAKAVQGAVVMALEDQLGRPLTEDELQTVRGCRKEAR